MNTVDS